MLTVASSCNRLSLLGVMLILLMVAMRDSSATSDANLPKSWYEPMALMLIGSSAY